MLTSDVIIIGAGASGLMCAIEAGKRKRKVLILEHSSKAGRKILISGGGRSNFTNYNLSETNYISHNPHFCKSALSRFSQNDFLTLMEKYGIGIEERAHGQLFCTKNSNDILNMLLAECRDAEIAIQTNTQLKKVEKIDSALFRVITNHGDYHTSSLVIATGGVSYPALGASPLGYELATQFKIKVWPPRPGLVPLKYQDGDKKKYSLLSGIAIPATVKCLRQVFQENILFTHNGLSGPAILQISSFWQKGEKLSINLLPEKDLTKELLQAKFDYPKQRLKAVLTKFFPKRLVESFIEPSYLESQMQALSQKKIELFARIFTEWEVFPLGYEAFDLAEVTVGGVDCDSISSKTMECKTVPGLYFIGEVLDVTGWLGGYNLQWAWSSGWCAGQYV